MNPKLTHPPPLAVEPNPLDQLVHLADLVFEFAEAIVSHRFEQAVALMGTGLQPGLSPSRFQQQVEGLCRAVLAERGIPGLYHPIDFNLEVYEAWPPDKDLTTQVRVYFRAPEPWPQKGVYAKVEFFASARLALKGFFEIGVLLVVEQGRSWVGGVEFCW